jgi:carboxylate-amine ligase
MHINLPFSNDEEFGKLHAAIRLLLPIIPGLTAASPVADLENKNYKDYRLEVYRHNQEKVPLIAGKVVPERAFTKEEYDEKIFKPLFASISSYDPEGLLQEEWLNSRGAIARFDRNAIEIRIIDIQECPAADIAIASVIIETLKLIANESYTLHQEQQQQDETQLSEIFLEVIQKGEDTVITNQAYLKQLGIEKDTIKVSEIWKILLERIPENNKPLFQPVRFILENGTLATRILKAVGSDFSKAHIEKVYRGLIECLENNHSFVPASVIK